MASAFQRLFDLRLPIMQAPMGGVSGPALAAAAIDAGALGSLPLWMLPPPKAAQVLRETRERAGGALSVNLRADLEQHEHVALAIDGGANAVHLFWGDPAPCASAVRSGGCRLLVTVGSVDDARRALDAGADLLVAQGWEAGGHVRGQVSTLALVPRVVELAGKVPVVAAGGIVDGAGVAAALALGAGGAMLGTRLAASLESTAHPLYKAALLRAETDHTVHLADLFGIGWPAAPHRTLRNSTVSAWEAAGCPAAPGRPGEGEVVAERVNGTQVVRYAVSTPSADVSGDIEAMALYAGQGIGGIRDVRPAADIIAAVWADARARLATLAAAVG